MALLGHTRGASRCCIGFNFSVFCGGPEEARYWHEQRCDFSVRRYRCPRRMTRGSRPPVPETGLLVSAGAKRRTTAGSDAFFTRRFAFSTHRNRCARCMTCGPGPPCQRLDRWLQQRRGGALPRGGSTLLGWRFAFLTVGRSEDEGAHYHGAVA
jgi:hypothetical protein